MSDSDDFHAEYAAALRAYMAARDEDSLAVAYELGRRALQEEVSLLAIIERHVQLILGLAKDIQIDAPIALEFLLQMLVPLDIATRGFLDGTRRFAR
ncbi:phosphatase RsbU N-terminal domain-containing protein, partial [Mycobacterium scrofulaceum]